MRAKERERGREEERERESEGAVQRWREEERTGGKEERHERKIKRQDARRTMRAKAGSDGIEDVGLMVTGAARFRRGSFSIATWAQRVRGETWPKVILHFFFFFFLLYFLSTLSSLVRLGEEREEPVREGGRPGEGEARCTVLVVPRPFC